MSTADQTPPDPAVAMRLGKELEDLKEKTGKLVTNEQLGESLAYLRAEQKSATEQIVDLAQRVADVPATVHRLNELATDKLLVRFDEAVRASHKVLKEEIATERTDRHREILASEGRAKAYTDASVGALAKSVDERFTALDLKLGVHVGDHERDRDEITGTIKVTRERVETIGGEVVAVKVSVEETKTAATEAKVTADGARKSVDDLNKEVGGFLASHKKEAGIGAGGVGLGIALYSAAPHIGGWISGAFESVKGLFQ